MKIYYMDMAWSGSIMVIASSQEEAHELAKGCYNYPGKDEEFEEYPIESGLVLKCLGDC